MKNARYLTGLIGAATLISLYCLSIVFLLNAVTEEAISTEVDPLSILFHYEWVGNIDRVKFPEPSGIVFHSQRGTLFAVGDTGDICEIRTDGTLIKQGHVRDSDFEGITHDPATGLLYIAIEGEEKILEIAPDDLNVLREITVPRTFNEKTLLKAGGQGLEGITFVPDPDHPEGGTFYITNQAFDFNDPEELSAVFQIEIPLKSGSGSNLTAKIIRFFSLGVIDLSGIYYDSDSDQIYVISDATNTILEITKVGTILRSYAFPGCNQEGITIDPEGFVYIPQDSGGILKIRWIRDSK